MENVLKILKIPFSVFMAVFTALTSLSVGNNFNIKKPDDVELTAALISDTHIRAMLYSRILLKPGLDDISKHVKPDLFISAGDNVDCGNEQNWQALGNMFDKYLSVDRKILSIGNHDTWVSYDTPHDFEPAKANFIKYAGEIMGEEIDNVYFTTEVNGYSFIVLGQEEPRTGSTISEEQLLWFEDALAAAAEKSEGKPIFVINHQPLNFTHAVGDNEHSNGFYSNETSDRIKSLLCEYKNVVYISGHQHYNLDADGTGEVENFKTVETLAEGVTLINLPSYEYGTCFTGGQGLFGQGIVMYVFADRIELCGRNFFLSNWQKDFDVTIELI